MTSSPHTIAAAEDSDQVSGQDHGSGMVPVLDLEATKKLSTLEERFWSPVHTPGTVCVWVCLTALEHILFYNLHVRRMPDCEIECDYKELRKDV